MKNNHYLIELNNLGDERGGMIVIENNKNIPFEVKRSFYTFKNINGDKVRGAHANRNSRFCFVCLNGSCDVIVKDGKIEKIYKLNSPTQMLYLDKMVWKEMLNFSTDSVLAIFSDCYYDSKEYINCFNKYQKALCSID